MKRFLYGFFAVTGSLDFKFYVNGTLHTVYKQSSLGEVLGQLSYDGWEIKSTVYSPEGSFLVFLQKEVDND